MKEGRRRRGAQGRVAARRLVVAAALATASARAGEPGFEAGRVAVGVFVGTVSLDDAHDLVAGPHAHVAYKPWNPEVGVRGSYFYEPWLGLEAELAGGVTRTRDAAERWGGLGALRLHAVVPVRLATSGVEPFVLVGAGALGAFTSAMGNDLDPAIHAGAGALVRAAPSWFLRAELRGTATPGYVGGALDPALHPEVLVGVRYAPAAAEGPEGAARAERAQDEVPAAR